MTVLNDADAAGVGEVHYGAARGVPGVVVLTTLAPASALPSSITASCCRTPSLGTSRLMVTTREARCLLG
ncbi:polyphosphate glucokinase [Cutibacterium acnes JCM 18918]|nr:polyphosphate glucokinase [Cutibacterium acnes JCM 18918]